MVFNSLRHSAQTYLSQKLKRSCLELQKTQCFPTLVIIILSSSVSNAILSPQSILSSRRISRGITTLPSSSVVRTTLSDFIV